MATQQEIDRWYEEEYLAEHKEGLIPELWTALMDASPEFKRYNYERHVMDRVLCNWGNCTDLVDAKGRIVGGFGPIWCPCDLTKDWHKEYHAQRSRPRPAVLPKGRRNRKKTRRSKSYLKHQRRMREQARMQEIFSLE